LEEEQDDVPERPPEEHRCPAHRRHPYPFDGATPQVRVRDGRVLVQYRGLPFDLRKRVATMSLNPMIPGGIDVVGGVSRVEADLPEVR